METKEDRLALMRWENETGPTAGKNKRPGKDATAPKTAKPGKTSGKRGNVQEALQKIPIVNMALTRAKSAPIQVKTPLRSTIAAGANKRPSGKITTRG